MIISPPFIPAPIAGETDEAFVERAMPGGAVGDGAYPLSFDLNWHGGVHLRAPQENGRVLPVRAIADGTLVYFRPPTEKADDPTHALNYGDGWTDNGCIVLRHETEIGEGERGQVVFFSIYMHLSKINIANPQLKQRIYRKDSIGEAGQIYGSAGKIHFEIIASDSQVEHLTGRSTRELDYRTHDGRTDSCWGDMYFYIPNSVEGFATPPTNFAQAAHSGMPAYRCPSLPDGWYTPDGRLSTLAFLTNEIDGYHPEIVKQLREGLIVRMHYERGQCQLTTYHVTGELVGSQNEDADFEYNLYTTATRRYPACPSAGYELLRFGRVLGPDALQPANAAHWRKISLPPRTEAGETERNAWFNLNAPGVTRFSDADFPHWMGWRLIDDDQDSDSHCQSDYIRREILEPPSIYAMQLPRRADAVSRAQSSAYDTMFEGDKRRLSEQYMDDRLRNTTYLVEANARGTLKRLICKFPTEWAREDFEVRYGWLKRVADGGPMSEDDFKELEKHQKALSFWEDANLSGINSKHWHLPPNELIKLYRKCYWYSHEEIKEIYPTASNDKINIFRKHINQTTSKYIISSPLRISHFFGQAGVETNQLTWMSELYSGNPFDYFRRYEKAKNYGGWLGNIKWNDGGNFRGRGLKQLTGRDNYARYWQYRGWISPESFSDRWWRNPKWWGIAGNTVTTTQYNTFPIQDNTTISQLETEMRPPTIQNPDIVTQDPSTSIDTAGWFWAKNRLISIADADNTAEMTRKIRGDGSSVGITSPWPAAANFPQRDALTSRIEKIIGNNCD